MAPSIPEDIGDDDLVRSEDVGDGDSVGNEDIENGDSVGFEDIEDDNSVEDPNAALVKHISSLPQLHEAIHESKIVVVYCYMLRCGFCGLMAPRIKHAAGSKEFESITFYKVNAEESEDIRDEYYMQSFPITLVFRLGKLFRFCGGYIGPAFEPWLESVLSASERATNGAVVSHKSLLKGNPPLITEITSLKSFYSIISTERVILYLYSSRSLEDDDLSALFECAATSLSEYEELGKYCILDRDMHAEIVAKLDLRMVTGAIAFYSGKMLGWSQAEIWGDFAEWLSDLEAGFGIASSAFTPTTVSSSGWGTYKTMPITDIANLMQLHETVSRHKHVALNFYHDSWPSSRAVLFLCERAAADKTFEDIYFAKVNVPEQEDIVRSLGIELSMPIEILFISGNEAVKLQPPQTFDELKELLEHINASEGYTETHKRSSPLTSEAERNPDVDVPATLSQVTLEQLTLDGSEKDKKEAIHSEDPKNAPGSHSTHTHAGNGTESRNSLKSQPPAFIVNRATCEGHSIPRDARPFYEKLFQPKPFFDPEKGCLFSPSSKRESLQIGTANEAVSNFSIALSCESHQNGETEMQFHINFMPDPTIGARFQSAVFEVTFFHEHDDGSHHSLTVRDFKPKDEIGDPTEVLVRKGLNTSIGVSAGPSLASLATSAMSSNAEEYTKKTASRVKGATTHTSTVMWTFMEDTGHAAEGGLKASYTVCAHIPRAEITSIRFWGKAMLVRARRMKVELRMGSRTSLYEKVVDLGGLHPEET